MQKLITTLLLLVLPAALFAADEQKGETIFKQRCASCHSVESKVVGPALKGINKRRSEQWIVKFINSSQSLIKSGDKDAVQVFNENNQILMPDHTDLNAIDIKNIVAYIVKADEVATAAQKTVVQKRPTEKHPLYKPIQSDDYFFWGVYFLIVLSLILILFLVTDAVSAIKKTRAEIAENQNN